MAATHCSPGYVLHFTFPNRIFGVFALCFAGGGGRGFHSSVDKAKSDIVHAVDCHYVNKWDQINIIISKVNRIHKWMVQFNGMWDYNRNKANKRTHGSGERGQLRLGTSLSLTGHPRLCRSFVPVNCSNPSSLQVGNAVANLNPTWKKKQSVNPFRQSPKCLYCVNRITQVSRTCNDIMDILTVMLSIFPSTLKHGTMIISEIHLPLP